MSDVTLNADLFVPAPEHGPGYRRDPLSGLLYYSSVWLDERRDATVSVLPGPDEALVADAERLASHEPADPEGARVIELQRRTLRADGWIGPRKTMLGLVPTDEDRVLLAGQMLVDQLHASARAAERLAQVAGVRSPIRTNAEGLSRGLTRMAERVEAETHGS